MNSRVKEAQNAIIANKDEADTAISDVEFNLQKKIDRILDKLDNIKETEFIFAHIQEKEDALKAELLGKLSK